MRNLPLLLILLISFTSTGQDVTSQLTSLSESDAGKRYRAIKSLQQLPKNAFDKNAQQLIINEIREAPAHLGELMKLAGYLQINEAKPLIRAIADSSRFSYRDRWTAYLALTRMNDEQAATFVYGKVSTLMVSDAFVYDIVPQVIYTRDRKLFDYLITVLNDDTPYCTSANPENEVRIPCGYRIMEALAPVIENYPLRLTASGDLDTGNYEKALTDIRRWFREHKNYEISRNSF